MCGDLRCRSCGPARGNFRCDACGRWADEGGCKNPERCAEISRAAAEAEAAAFEESEKALDALTDLELLEMELPPRKRKL
jgi:hypothetical protein